MTVSFAATLLSLGLTIAAGGVLLRAFGLGWRGWSAAFLCWTIVLTGLTAVESASMATASALREHQRDAVRTMIANPLGSPRELRRQMIREGRLKDDGASAYPWGQPDAGAWQVGLGTRAGDVVEWWPFASR